MVFKRSKIDSLVSRFEYRLLQLDIVLNERYAAGLIKKKAYEKKRKSIEELEEALELYQKNEQELGKLIKQHIFYEIDGLPELTKTEERVCKTIYNERFKELTSFNTYLLSLSNSLEKALRGRVGRISLVFKLAKMKRLIKSLEKKIRDVEFDERILKNFSDRVAKEISFDSQNRYKKTALALGKVFHDIDLTQGRITQKQVHVSKEEKKVAQMMDWLYSQELQLEKNHHIRSATNLPTPIAIEKAVNEVRGLELATLSSVKKKIDMTSQFLNNLVESEEPLKSNNLQTESEQNPWN